MYENKAKNRAEISYNLMVFNTCKIIVENLSGRPFEDGNSKPADTYQFPSFIMNFYIPNMCG